VRPLDPALLGELGAIVGADQVVVDPDIVASYAVDWTGRFQGETPAVVRPGNLDQVAAVVDVCRGREVALVPQGGNTGLVGGGVPLGGEIVLSLRRLSAIGEVDPLAGQLTAGAGATVADVHRAATAAGWVYGVDLGSRDSATVGGTVATNAGGLHVLRHGATRAQVMGIEAVLGTGATISHLGGLVKDNTGYDLAGLICGSEGTLAVVTAARLRLVPPSPHQVAALIALPGPASAVRAATGLRRSLPELQAAECFFDAGLALVCETLGLAPPFADRHPAYLLIEVAGQEDPTEATAEALASIAEVADVAVATDPARRAQLWRYREGHTEAVNSLGQPHKMDVTLPAAALASFIEEVPDAVRRVAPHAATWLWGHVADGNVHVNVTGVAPRDDAVDDQVLTMAASFGGSISAEHGIGTAKRRWLHLNRSPAEMAAFGAIKQALDPAGVLNPGVLFSPV